MCRVKFHQRKKKRARIFLQVCFTAPHTTQHSSLNAAKLLYAIMSNVAHLAVDMLWGGIHQIEIERDLFMQKSKKTEIEKRIEEGASEYIKTCKDNMHSVSEAYCKADFKAGAKFILELPELREAVEALEWYAIKGEGPYSDARIYRRAESALETLKKAGLV